MSVKAKKLKFPTEVAKERLERIFGDVKENDAVLADKKTDSNGKLRCDIIFSDFSVDGEPKIGFPGYEVEGDTYVAVTSISDYENSVEDERKAANLYVEGENVDEVVSELEYEFDTETEEIRRRYEFDVGDVLIPEGATEDISRSYIAWEAGDILQEVKVEFGSSVVTVITDEDREELVRERLEEYIELLREDRDWSLDNSARYTYSSSVSIDQEVLEREFNLKDELDYHDIGGRDVSYVEISEGEFVMITQRNTVSGVSEESEEKAKEHVGELVDKGAIDVRDPEPTSLAKFNRKLLKNRKELEE